MSYFTCPHCNKQIFNFQSETAAPAGYATAPPVKGFWASLWASDLGIALGLFGSTWVFTWAYEYSPLWAVGAGFVTALGLPVLRLVLDRPVVHQPKPKPDKVRVDVQIDDHSDGGFTRYLDSFNPDLVGWDDLVKLARAEGFSRAAAASVGLSQDKWHKLKAEFIRLNYAVPLPNGAKGYALTLRGRRLLDKIVVTPTNNNKQQRFKAVVGSVLDGGARG